MWNTTHHFGWRNNEAFREIMAPCWWKICPHYINIFAVVILTIKIRLTLNFCVKDTLICNITLHNSQIDCQNTHQSILHWTGLLADTTQIVLYCLKWEWSPLSVKFKMVLLSKKNICIIILHLQQPQLATSEFPKISRSDILIRKCD